MDVDEDDGGWSGDDGGANDFLPSHPEPMNSDSPIPNSSVNTGFFGWG